jgi:hypothetical protein
MKDAPLLTSAGPSPWRAWLYLVRTSWQRQARAHLMVWIALGLLLFLTLWVTLLTSLNIWDVRTWRQPRRGGLTFVEWEEFVLFAPDEVLAHRPPPELFKPARKHTEKWVEDFQRRRWTQKEPLDKRHMPPPYTLAADPIQFAVAGAYAAALDSEGFRRDIAIGRFTRDVIFGIFTTFLLPLCSLTFATEALGREREQHNLVWTLTRPLPRWAIYLGKFVAVLPWCLALNLGGFCLVCAAGGDPGAFALATYWPAVALGTLAFAALFHLMGAVFRRPAVIAILYSFFLETVMGNLPGHLKRASISYYMRSLMYDSASIFQLQPDRPQLFAAVSGPVAVAVLVGLTVALLAAGAWYFSRTEYLDLA